MAIEAGWDPDAGLPLPGPPPFGFEPEEPAWVPLSEAEQAWLVELDRGLPVEDVCPWSVEECPEPEPAPEPAPGASAAAEPAWAVPGVTDEEAAEGGLSAPSEALLAEVAAAVEEQRRAGARLYRAITAIHAGDVLAETRYRTLGRLLEDHVGLDPATAARLERHAAALHPTVTPTGATVEADLPATASAVQDGTVDEQHVEIIRRTMLRLRTVPALDDTVLGVAEEQLAGLAAARSPRQLAGAAKAIADRLDPDGAAPVEDDPTGNELRWTKRRSGHLHAKLILRDPVAAALFDDAVSAATPAPASAVVADPDSGVTLGADQETRASKPARQANGLLDLIAASHRAGLDHTDAEQYPGSPTASMPLPDLDDHTGHDDHGAAGGDDLSDPLPGNGTSGDDSGDDSDEEATEDDEPSMFGADPDPEAPPAQPPHRPWTPPDPATMAGPGRERVTLTVTADYQTLRQQLADTSRALALLGDSTWIRPETARRLACDADIIPMVLGSKGEVLDVGRRTRTIPTATGRAVITRDRHCAFPGCRRRARTTEIHHIQHWADHGETEPDNLVCLCRYHHDLVHHSGWEVLMIDHHPWFRPPRWLDPTRTLRHNRPWTITAA